MVFPGQGFLFDGLCLVISEKTFLPPCGTSHSTTSVYCVTFAPCFSLEWLGVVGRICPGFFGPKFMQPWEKEIDMESTQDSKKSKGSLMYPPAGTDRTVASPSAKIWDLNELWVDVRTSYRSKGRTGRTRNFLQISSENYENFDSCVANRKKKHGFWRCTWIGGAHQPRRLPFMFHATGQLAQAKIETDLTGRNFWGENRSPVWGRTPAPLIRKDQNFERTKPNKTSSHIHTKTFRPLALPAEKTNFWIVLNLSIPGPLVPRALSTIHFALSAFLSNELIASPSSAPSSSSSSWQIEGIDLPPGPTPAAALVAPHLHLPHRRHHHLCSAVAPQTQHYNILNRRDHCCWYLEWAGKTGKPVFSFLDSSKLPQAAAYLRDFAWFIINNRFG